ncbi:MAG: LysR family transcriptional regulator [Akkermansiaceae bacterium]
MLNNVGSYALLCLMSMADFDLRKLEYFLAVAEGMNISRAAKKLGMTQPALSRQIRAFEESLGWELLERGKKSIKLTRAGEVVVKEGERILKSVELGVKRMRQEIEGAEMRVGYAPSLASGLIEKVIACFSEKYPRVRVSWFDCSSQEMWSRLKSRELDLILEVESGDPEIRWERLSEREMRVAVPPGHEYARKRFLAPDHLNGQRLLLLSRHEYPGYWDQVSGYFADQNIDAKIAGEFDGISSLKMGVEAGLGMAFVAGRPEGMTTVKLKPEPNPICIAMGSLKSRQLSEWEQAFVDEMVKAAR